MKEKCTICKFSIKEKDKIFCRLNPPYVIPIQRLNQISNQIEMGHMSIYPQVVSDNWCGRYVRKLEGVK